VKLRQEVEELQVSVAKERDRYILHCYRSWSYRVSIAYNSCCKAKAKYYVYSMYS
jgi:hypothetical protein